MIEEFVDYSTILMRIVQAEKAMHDACLQKQFHRVPALADYVIAEANKLKEWAAAQ